MLHAQIFKDVFASNSGDGCAQHLHRCEGMTWGPDERLYVSAFAANKDDLDTAAEVRHYTTLDIPMLWQDCSGMRHETKRLSCVAFCMQRVHRFSVPLARCPGSIAFVAVA